jgi:hypothetical protein
MRYSYKILLSNSKRKRQHAISRIELDLKEAVCEGVDWTQLEQDGVQWRALVNTVVNHRLP